MVIHFVVGTGRCGSSLVHEILASHEHVGFVSNFDDNLPGLRLSGRFNNAMFALSQGAFTQKGRLRFAPSEAFRLIRNQVSPVYENSCRDLMSADVTPWLRSRFQNFFESRWRAQGGRCFLHKYTGWPRIGFFAEIFPQARFIHIVRDGRAVANSWLQMDWWGGYRGPEHWPWGVLASTSKGEWEDGGRSFITLAGLSWRILMDSFLAASAKLDSGRYMEVRYEDFVKKPIESLRAMTDFVDLPWSNRIERAVSRSRIRDSRERAFEKELTADQVAELERVTGDVLARYRYV